MKCHYSTIQRRLREAGLFGPRHRKNPYLSQTSSVKFSKDSLILDFENWLKVLFRIYQGSHFIEVMGMYMLMAGEKFNNHSVVKSVRMDVYTLLG